MFLLTNYLIVLQSVFSSEKVLYYFSKRPQPNKDRDWLLVANTNRIDNSV